METRIGEEGGKLHIVMIPWLAMGHLIPFLELSKLIALKGHKVSYISTPRNIDRLPKLPPSLASQISFVKLPLPHVENLPENAEATIEVPYEKVKYLKLAHDALQEPMAKFLEDASPDWVFLDFNSYWLPPIASKLGVSTAYFSVYPASFLGFLGPVPSSSSKLDYEERKTPEDFTVPPKWVPFQSSVAFRLFEISRIFNESVKGEEDNVSDLFRVMSVIEGVDILSIRSYAEFEPEWFKLLEDIHGKPVIPVEPFPNVDDAAASSSRVVVVDDAWEVIKGWLDKQATASVVYIAFGSEAKPSQAELTEIALGLELSGLPFFWVLRTKRGEIDTQFIQLPEGFEERTKGRGVVCTSWAPQLKILSHDSVGGFFTHSGWGSVLEAIRFGMPIIALPFLTAQGPNARVLEEKKDWLSNTKRRKKRVIYPSLGGSLIEAGDS